MGGAICREILIDDLILLFLVLRAYELYKSLERALFLTDFFGQKSDDDDDCKMS